MRSSIELETKANVFADIVKAANEAFVDHKISREGETSWRCNKSDTGIYLFRVGELPGAIVLWGDIGSLIIDAGMDYNISWLRGSIKSYRYVLEKSSLSKKDWFYPGEFKELAVERELNELIEDGDWSEEAFKEYSQSSGDCDAADAVYGYSPDILWRYQGLKKFTELLIAQ